MLEERSLIVPLLKDGASNKHVPSSYRSISLIHSVYKIYKLVLLDHLNDFIDSNDTILAE